MQFWTHFATCFANCEAQPINLNSALLELVHKAIYSKSFPEYLDKKDKEPTRELYNSDGCVLCFNILVKFKHAFNFTSISFLFFFFFFPVSDEEPCNVEMLKDIIIIIIIFKNMLKQ